MTGLSAKEAWDCRQAICDLVHDIREYTWDRGHGSGFSFDLKFDEACGRLHRFIRARDSADEAADEAMGRIWSEWFTFYTNHLRGAGLAISAADQMAFYEIAQPIMRALASAKRE